MAKKRAKPVKTKQKRSFFEPIKHFFTNKRVHFVVGMLICFFTIYCSIAIISYFFTGASDQSVVKNFSLPELIKPEGVVSNWAGLRGAYMADVFIDRWFGVSVLFLVFFVASIGVKWMKLCRIRLLHRFLICSLLTIWGSLLCAFVFPYLGKSFFFELGGQHGKTLADILKVNIGFPGIILVLLAGLFIISIIINARTVPVIQSSLTFGNPADETEENEAYDSTDNEEVMRAGKATESWDNRKSEDNKDDVKEAHEREKSKKKRFGWFFLRRHENDTEHEKAENQGEDNTRNKRKKDKKNIEEPVDAKPPKTGDTTKIPVPEDAFVIEVPKGDDETFNREELGAYDPRLDLSHYKFPNINLLKKYDQSEYQVDISEQNENQKRIKKTLEDFQINITSIKATVGSTITLYEVVPDKGVRISKIRNLEDDIALSLSALGIRIIAPMPGKGTIGIEVPNKNPQIVSMESVIASRKFGESKFELPVVLGRTITNEVYMFDLTKMPHLLVAGATGQGKSVGLNAIITSLLYKKHPSELKLVLVDPKMVEFNIYENIERHYLAKLNNADRAIITDFNDVIDTLKSLCKEMDNRYDLLTKAHVRNISEYNTKFINRHLNPEKGHKFMPYIVVIIDEFGDLIMTAGKEIEMPIARIAQKARAVGIHMIIATQRPSTNIITGTIKANFPARVAFRVSSMIDSRTILDSPGANKLVGRGDSLFKEGNEFIRVQCAYVSTNEIEEIVTYIGDQTGFETAYILPEAFDENQQGSPGAIDLSNRDPLFDDAARLVVIHQQGSTSHIQRKFSIGYNRAGRLMDQLEAAGVVGSFEGNKGRQVLITDEYALEQLLNRLQ